MAHCQGSDNKISDMDWSIGGGGYHARNGRFGSSSSQTSQNSGDICRICHCESEPQNPLLTPCYCSGSLKYVHQSCLQQWLTASETTSCELCKFPFIMHTKIKPFNEWRALQMSGIERRRLFCSVLFHCAAATCVIWSLCVLIERATEEVKKGQISWPFWTKLVVVTVGLTGGVVFMYIQCKAYLSLCTRWRARNRILLIQNAPEKVAPLHQDSIDLRDSPPLMFNRTAASVGSGIGTPGLLSSNASGMGTAQVSTMALNRSVYSAASHGQIVANIESNSQIHAGVFHAEDQGYPCGGVEEPGVSSNLNMFNVHHHSHHYQPHGGHYLDSQEISGEPQHEMCPTRFYEETHPNAHYHHHPQQQQQQFQPSRSKFNRQRHSLWVGDAGMVGASSSAGQSDFRRYSDTRLIMEPHEPHMAAVEHEVGDGYRVFNVDSVFAPPLGYSNNNSRSQSNMTMEGTSAVTAVDVEETPQITDILFESAEHGSSFDPLELNIQELLEMDIRTNVRGTAAPVVDASAPERDFHSSQLSVNSDPQKYYRRGSGRGIGAGVLYGEDGTGPMGDVSVQSEQRQHLLTPQSLPNLSASSEDLLQRQRVKDAHHELQ